MGLSNVSISAGTIALQAFELALVSVAACARLRGPFAATLPHPLPSIQDSFTLPSVTRRKTCGRVPDSSGTARAIDYALRRWTALRRYLDDGTYPIDNNPVENAIRPVALGRKNWLFAGAPPRS